MTLDAELLAIRQQVISVLNHPTCRGIHFRYQNCVVNGAQYLSVIRHLESDRIHVEHKEPGSGGSAQYDDATDTVYVQSAFLLLPGLRQADERTCVHELTHAVYDQQCLGSQPTLDSEIVAYVAEHIFIIRAGFPSSQSSPLEVAASAIARFVAGRSGTVITEGMAQNLLTALSNHRLYREQRSLRSQSNGVGGCPRR